MKSNEGKKIKKKASRDWYYIIGYYFLLLQVVILLENKFVIKYNIFFWFCDHVPLIFAIGFLFKNKDLIKGFINFGFLVQFIWTVDFFIRLMFGVNFLKVTTYIFEGQFGYLVLIPIFAHMLSVNLALFMTYKIKPTKKTLSYSAIYIVFIYFLTLTYAPVERNVNCVYEICGLTQYTFPGYTYLWPVLVFVLMVLPTQGIQYLLYKWSKNRRNRYERRKK